MSPRANQERVLAHEGVGFIEAVGAGVATFKPGERVIISCISACGRSEYCRKGMNSNCVNGGWILGNTIDGMQAEYVRIPYTDTSLYRVADNTDEEAVVMLGDILQKGFECGVLNGKSQPGATVAVVGEGLAALHCGTVPSDIIMVDVDDNRLRESKRFGATATVNGIDGKVAEGIMRRAGERGVDSAIERLEYRLRSGFTKTKLYQAGPLPTSACTDLRWTSI